MKPTRAELILDALPEDVRQGICAAAAELVRRRIKRAVDAQQAHPPKRTRDEARDLRAL